MVCDIRNGSRSHEKRATPSLAIVSRNGTVVACTTPLDATATGIVPPWSDEIAELVCALIERLDDGGLSASGTLAEGRHVRIFPLLGLGAFYAVSIEFERSEPSFAAMAERFGLTLRESEVLPLLVNGSTNPEIARALDIRETTVISHVHNIGLKVGATKRSSIIARVLGFSNP